MNMTKGVNEQTGVEEGGNESDKKIKAIGTQFTKEGIFHEIGNLETEIELRYADYQAMTQGLKKTVAMAPQPVEKDPLKIRVARWLVDRPKQKPQPVSGIDLSDEQRELIKTEANKLLQDIYQKIERREELMGMLELEERVEIDGRQRLGLIIGGIKEKAAKATIVGSKKISVEGLEDKNENDYSDFIMGLRLTPEQQGKMLLIVKDYDEAVATAREFDTGIKVPSKKQVIAHIMALGARKLEKIASVMGKPRLIVTPANQSFREMKDSMDLDVNRHYFEQNNAGIDDNYEWSGGRKEVGVSIVDMKQYIEPVPGQQPDKQTSSEQLGICEKYFRDMGMHLIHDYEYAVAMQRSLRAYKKAKKAGAGNPEGHILDFFVQTKKTVTLLNQEHNKEISKVAYGLFFLGRSAIGFGWSRPASQDDDLRGRGAVRVM